MRNIPIICRECGKTYEIEIKDLDKVDEHTFVAKCDCGATTQIEGDPEKEKASLKDIHGLLDKVPELLQEFRRTRAKGMDTGIGDAVSAVAKEMAIEVLTKDSKLREALAKAVKDNLAAYLIHFTGETQKS